MQPMQPQVDEKVGHPHRTSKRDPGIRFVRCQLQPGDGVMRSAGAENRRRIQANTDPKSTDRSSEGRPIHEVARGHSPDAHLTCGTRSGITIPVSRRRCDTRSAPAVGDDTLHRYPGMTRGRSRDPGIQNQDRAWLQSKGVSANCVSEFGRPPANGGLNVATKIDHPRHFIRKIRPEKSNTQSAQLPVNQKNEDRQKPQFPTVARPTRNTLHQRYLRSMRRNAVLDH